MEPWIPFIVILIAAAITGAVAFIAGALKKEE